MKLYQDRDWLEQKYWGKGLSTPQIAYLCGVHPSSIKRGLIRFNIPRRTGSECHKGQVAWNKGLTAKGDKRILFGEHGSNWKGGKTKKICKICGKKFEVWPSQTRKGVGSTCSRICQNESFRDGRYKGKNNPNWDKYHSEETRKKMGKGNRGKKSPFNTQREIKCDYCNKKIIRKKSEIKKSKNLFCDVKCKGKFLAKEIKVGNRKVDYFLGHKHTEEAKKKISEATSINLLKATKKRPTWPEQVFDDITPICVRYVGNSAWWRKMPNGKNKNPDFKITGQNKVIEVFGDYWHKGENPQELIDLYAQAGLNCLVFWESEIYESPEQIKEKVNNFISQ